MTAQSEQPAQRWQQFEVGYGASAYPALDIVRLARMKA